MAAPGGALDQTVSIAFRFLYVAVGALALLWLGSGFVPVEPGARAVVLRFGAVVRTTDAGLVWAWPRPIEEVVRLPGPDRQLTQAVAVLDVPGRASGSAKLGAALDLRENGYLITGDGGVIHLAGTVTYRVAEPVAYLAARERLAPAIERAFCTAAIRASAGRTIDGVLSAGAGNGDLQAAERRERLAGDLRAVMNRTLGELATGVEVLRVDLNAGLPDRAKPFFEQVVAAESEAARKVAESRTDAERYRQDGQQQRTRLIEQAQAAAREEVVRATVATDRIAALAAEATPERRALLLTRLYRERIEAVLARAGSVSVVPNGPVRLIVPGAEAR
jgi:regulator of protease activity HflC (stomatin/prohibitin superfamily)